MLDLIKRLTECNAYLVRAIYRINGWDFDRVCMYVGDIWETRAGFMGSADIILNPGLSLE